MEQTIPLNLLLEISKHLSYSAQPQFRLLNTYANSLPTNIQTCCKLPSNSEIANWLLNQSKLLTDLTTRDQCILKLQRNPIYTLRIKHNLPYHQFEFINQEKDTTFLTLTSIGRIYDIKPKYSLGLNTKDQILNTLHGSTIILKPTYGYIDNWFMIKDIISSRSKCAMFSEVCIIELLKIYGVSYEQNIRFTYVFQFLNFLLSDSGKQKFINLLNLVKLAPQEYVFTIDDFMNISDHIRQVNSIPTRDVVNFVDSYVNFMNSWLQTAYSQLTQGDIQ